MTLRLLFMVCLICSSAAARVVYDGNRAFHSKQLEELRARTGAFNAFIEAVAASYVNEGYFNSEVVVLVEVDTTIIFREGRRYTDCDLLISGIPNALLDLAPSTPGNCEPLTAAGLQTILRRMVKDIAEQGFPFCSFVTDSLLVDDQSVILFARVLPGPQTAIGEVRYTGLRSTQPTTLNKRVSLRQGELFRESDLSLASRSLQRLDFVELQDAPRVIYQPRGGTVDLLFPMREERNLQLDGLIYLLPDNSFAGDLDLALLNLFGSGERFRFEWQRLSRITGSLRFAAFWPYLRGLPLDFGFDLSQSDRDSSFTSNAIRGELTAHLSLSWKSGLAASWKKVSPVVEFGVNPARELEISLSTELDRRDNVRLPRQGARFRYEFASSYRREFRTSDGITTGYSNRLDGSLQLWLPLGRRVVMMHALRPFQVRSDFDPIPLDHLIPVGGVRSLRGFRDYFLIAEIGVTSQSEIRYDALENASFRIFVDNGWLRFQDTSVRLTGIGAGMSVITTLGLFRLDFALGEQKQFDNLLVHFGVEAQF